MLYFSCGYGENYIGNESWMNFGWSWNVEDYVTLEWFCDIMEMKLLRCELWLWLMKLEDGNMLWICRLKIWSFGWIMFWWKVCIFCISCEYFVEMIWNISKLYCDDLD